MKWRVLRKVKSEEGACEINEIVKVLLANRGFTTKKAVEEFLHPSLKLLNASFFDPEELEKALKRVHGAIANKEKIIVYSDYDVDGITAAAILWETLHELHAAVMPYVPSRMDEGYGLSTKGIDAIAEKYPDCKLIITVDHGITAVAQVNYAKKKEIDVIITDHHSIPSVKPKAYAIVHTTKLAGSGVSYLFSHALANKEEYDLDHLSLAALGTIADLVPLTGVNRVVAKFGLAELNQTKRAGLQALIAESGLKDKQLGTYDVSHVLAPRINASGRLTHAIDSLRLLCTTDKKRAVELARLLGETNLERQTIMGSATEDATSKVTDDNKLIFISHKSYHEGVIGLVAGRLVEKYYRPAIVIAKKEKFSKASARSIAGFNIIEAIRTASELLVDCGGHPMAAGFTVATDKIELLQKQLTSYVNMMLSDELLTKELRVDMELPLNFVNKKLYNAIQQFQPFGIGNPEPVFVSRGVRIRDARTMGIEGKHLKLVLAKDATTFEAVGFGMGKLYTTLSPDTPIDLAYTISTNTWNGQEKIQMKIRDLMI